MSKFATYYVLRIPLSLPPPRDSICHCVKIIHEGSDPGGSGLATALRQLVSWADNHDKLAHPKLPAEYATKSYLKRPVMMSLVDGRSKTDCQDVLEQLYSQGCKMRVVTTKESEDFNPLHMTKELFAGSDHFDAWTTIEEPAEAS